MCCCGDKRRRRGMARDANGFLEEKERCDIDCLRRKFGIADDSCWCEMAISICVWAMALTFASLITLLAQFLYCEALSGTVVGTQWKDWSYMSLGAMEDRQLPLTVELKFTWFSLEVGKVTRLLHLWAILGSVVCVGVWCYLGLFRKYKEQNKGIKTLIIIYNTATEMCLVLCTLVWCVNLGDQITQKAYPLLLASATATFTVSFLSSWALLIVPNKVIGNTHTQLSQTPSVEKITVHRL
ncbi:uncharacterized protein LOC142338438 isoform X2 [Convolutriloba macropyga]|uniref:uncharacterized protein LOC142338438 isoform X2 n=1 Tax=Convolutriloba macropyga TaxID=536237 RepID=UPI003F51F142